MTDEHKQRIRDGVARTKAAKDTAARATMDAEFLGEGDIVDSVATPEPVINIVAPTPTEPFLDVNRPTPVTFKTWLDTKDGRDAADIHLPANSFRLRAVIEDKLRIAWLAAGGPP